MFFFDSRDNTIWNKRTLEQFSLNEIAGEYLREILSSDESSLSEDALAFSEQLRQLGIDVGSVESWSNQSRTLKTPIVHIIRNCNSPCVMCDCWQTKGRQLIDADIAQGLFKQLRIAGATSVMISGGEPTLHPSLKEILLACQEEGLAIELNTNGILLNRMEWLPEIDLSALVISMDGFDSETYKLMRGTNKFERVLANTVEFKKASPSTVIGYRTTLSRTTLLQLPRLLETARQGAVDVISFSPLDVSSNSFSRDMSEKRSAKLISLLLPTINELQDIYVQLEDPESSLGLFIDEQSSIGRFAWGRDGFARCVAYYLLIQGSDELARKNHPELLSYTACRFPSTSLVLDYDGSILPCFYGKSFATTKTFDGIRWEPLELENQMEKSGRCLGCRGKVFCPR